MRVASVLLVLVIFGALLWGWKWSQSSHARSNLWQGIEELEAQHRGSLAQHKGAQQDETAINRPLFYFWKVFLATLHRNGLAHKAGSWLVAAGPPAEELQKWQRCLTNRHRSTPASSFADTFRWVDIFGFSDSCMSQYQAILSAASFDVASDAEDSSSPSHGPPKSSSSSGHHGLDAPHSHLSSDHRQPAPVHSVLVEFDVPEVTAQLVLVQPLSGNAEKQPPYLPLVLWHLDYLLDLGLFLPTVGRKLSSEQSRKLITGTPALGHIIPGYDQTALLTGLLAAAHQEAAAASSLAVAAKLRIVGLLLSGSAFFEASQDVANLAPWSISPSALTSQTHPYRLAEPDPNEIARHLFVSNQIPEAFVHLTKCKLPRSAIQRLLLLHGTHSSLALGTFLQQSLSLDPSNPIEAIGLNFFTHLNNNANFLLRYIEECQANQKLEWIK